MAIDLTKDFDKQTIRRISNLEERVKDVLTAQQQFSTNIQLNELLAAITVELQALKATVNSLETRVSIVEDNPDID
tara:strand:- start:236 stop:463 length:228 start_codon:yes stop_codon:yes gene_type:complete